MSLLLNIDTATDTAAVSLAKDGHILQLSINKEPKGHGAFLQNAIGLIAQNAGIKLCELDAVAVVAGPGSYTGLRVGMASAKGLCYALNKPLITVGTLEVMAGQAIRQLDNHDDFASLFCPMIDARRLEVFTALFNYELEVLLSPVATILTENFLSDFLLEKKILFFGNGAEKFEGMCKSRNAKFLSLQNNALYLGELTLKKFNNQQFSNVAYVEPTYIKEFYSSS